MREPTKTVTVLFTDLVGSTAMSERLGPDEGRRLAGRHLAAQRDSLSVHRGTEVKSMGDGIMAAFESVLDAIAAAVTMQRAISRHNRQNPDRELGIWIGIGVGEAAPIDNDWYGTPVVEAARLCAACGGGEIYLTDVVRMIAGSDPVHRLEEVGRLSLKASRSR